MPKINYRIFTCGPAKKAFIVQKVLFLYDFRMIYLDMSFTEPMRLYFRFTNIYSSVKNYYRRKIFPKLQKIDNCLRIISFFCRCRNRKEKF